MRCDYHQKYFANYILCRINIYCSVFCVRRDDPLSGSTSLWFFDWFGFYPARHLFSFRGRGKRHVFSGHDGTDSDANLYCRSDRIFCDILARHITVPFLYQTIREDESRMKKSSFFMFLTTLILLGGCSQSASYIFNREDQTVTVCGNYVVLGHPAVVIHAETFEIFPLIRDVYETDEPFQIFTDREKIYCMFSENNKIASIDPYDFSETVLYENDLDENLFNVNHVEYSFELFERNNITQFYVHDGLLYFYNDLLHRISSVNPITNSTHVLLENVTSPIFTSNEIYYLNRESNVMKCDFFERKSTALIIDYAVYSIYKTDERLWFNTIANGGRVGYLSQENEAVLTEITARIFSVEKDTIYYSDNQNGLLYSCDLDGDIRQLTDYRVPFFSLLRDYNLLYCYTYDGVARHLLIDKENSEVIFEYKEQNILEF